MVSRAEIVTAPPLFPIKPRLVNVLALAVAVSRATTVAVNDQVELAGMLIRLVASSSPPPSVSVVGVASVVAALATTSIMRAYCVPPWTRAKLRLLLFAYLPLIWQ